MKKQPLGQNYLIDESIALEIIQQAGVNSDQNVLEIGRYEQCRTAKMPCSNLKIQIFEIDHFRSLPIENGSSQALLV